MSLVCGHYRQVKLRSARRVAFARGVYSESRAQTRRRPPRPFSIAPTGDIAMNMKMIKPLLFTTMTALSLGSPLVQAQAAAPTDGKAAAADKEAPPYGGWGPGYGMDSGITCMGPGMMGGGWGAGPGMMGGGWGWGKDLSDLSADQRTRIAKIRDETRRKNWELMGQLMDEQARLRDMYDAPKRDADAMSNAYKKINDLQR